jgi:hypothetical protein
MNTSVVSPPQARARGIEFLPDAFVVHLEDGRSLTVPLEWFPRLRDATLEQRSHWRFIGPGTGIHWPDIDEDISVAGLLGPARLIKRVFNPGDTRNQAIRPSRARVWSSPTLLYPAIAAMY